MYKVLCSFDRHIALVIKETPKVVTYVANSATGPGLFNMPPANFAKKYYRVTPSTPQEAAFAFLKLAKRAYLHNPQVIIELKYVINTYPLSKQEIDIMQDTKPTPAQEAALAKKVEKAAKLKAEKPPKESKPRGQGIGDFCKTQIAAGLTNAQILDALSKAIPGTNTKIASINWYRNDMKKKGV